MTKAKWKQNVKYLLTLEEDMSMFGQSVDIVGFVIKVRNHRKVLLKLKNVT